MANGRFRTFGILGAIGLFCGSCTVGAGQSDEPTGDGEAAIGTVQQALWNFWGGLIGSPSHVVGIGNSDNNGRTYTWLDNGTVCKGFYHTLCQETFSYSAPGGDYDEIMEIAIAHDTSQIYTYYSDGTYSRGTPTNLTQHAGKKPLTLGPFDMHELIGVDHSRNGKMYYYWEVADGDVYRTTGTSNNVVAHDPSWSLPSTWANRIVDVSSIDGYIWGISFDDYSTGDPHELWTFYESGRVNIAGQSLDLDN